jgi:Sulfotransferase family
MESPIEVIYIAGSGRSGSTLLERMLGHLPGFLPVGELAYIWHRGFRDSQLCSCGRAFLECEFWKEVAAAAYGSVDQAPQERLVPLISERNRIRFIPQYRFPALRRPSFKRDLSEMRDLLSPLYLSLMRTPDTSAIIDSSKSPPYAYLLGSIPEITVSVVHLVRDSRGVSYSWQKLVRRPEVIAKTEYMGGFSPAVTAHKWNVTNGLSELLRFSARAYVRVRYEDLVARPQETIGRILNAIGYQDLTIPAFGDEPNTVAVPPHYHTVSGNPIRLEREALRIRADVEWRTNLGFTSTAVVTAMTLPLLLRYGYGRS